MEEDNELGTTPQWLKPLLETKFFNPCRDHGRKADFHKNSECKYFCLDCIGAPFCSFCLIHHTQHRILQIRRSSFHSVVRINEVKKHIDISGIQHYITNKAKTVFLNPRPLSRPSIGFVVVTTTCEICSRPLLDSFRFCSLSCKLEGMKRGDQELTFSVGIHDDTDTDSSTPKKHCKDRLIVSSDGSNHSGENGVKDTVPSINSHRRKGIPHRAPPF